MRKVFLGIILSATYAIAFTQSASALEPVIADNQIQVTGIVLPTHYVTINEYGDILKIVSNTTEDVRPQIYLNNVLKENQVPLTDDVYVFYRELVPEGTSRIGTLYELPVSSIQPKLLTSDPGSLRNILN